MSKHRASRLYDERYFNEILALEKKRCERSRVQVLLMLADLADFQGIRERLKIAKVMMEALSDITRETDVKGWYVEDSVIGVLFTEMAGRESAFPFTPRHVASKCVGRLRSSLGADSFSRIDITWHVLPEEFPGRNADEGSGQEPESPATGVRPTKRRVELVGKKLVDVIGSIFATMLFAPASL